MSQNSRNNSTQTHTYQHENETRTNIPSPGLAPDGNISEVPKSSYYYNPHLQPILRSADTDSMCPQIKNLLLKAQKEALTLEEVQELANSLYIQPWLEWANKREEDDAFTVESVPLFIHERLSTQAILETAKRNDIQRILFADPQQKYQDAIQFYEHEVRWSNRLILGDSLHVMDSLANREGLAGQVQMIYIDPPYGINFRSNFQPDVFKTKVEDREKDLTREIEQIKAYRDTWKLGIHSYLSYLRKRFVIARELLKDSGSIFVQIGDNNVHRVRCLLDEIFGPNNFVGEIVYKTQNSTKSNYLSLLNDFIVWYAKDINQLKFRPLYIKKELQKRFSKAELSNGEIIPAFSKGSLIDELPEDAMFFQSDPLSGGASPNQSFIYQDKEYPPSIQKGGWRVTLEGLQRLAKADRIYPQTTLRYKYFFSDFDYIQLGNLWSERLHEQNKNYVVQTNRTVIKRCMLMSTDPGDLVIDPTCGGGTTAYVAEQWGRRWITIDTSRIAITLARTRLLTANYPYYKLRNQSEGVGGGFVFETAPHIETSDIANNTALDVIFAQHEPILTEKLKNLNIALKQVTPEIRQELQRKLAAKPKRDVTEADLRRWNLPETAWKEWEVPFDIDPAWPDTLQDALEAYRISWRSKMDEVNTCIKESAKHEELVDQPKIEKHIVRVTGPFTVESVQPSSLSLDETVPSIDGGTEPANAAAYLEQMCVLLKNIGVDFENEKKYFSQLNQLNGDLRSENQENQNERENGALFHAEGYFDNEEEEVGVVFGPQYGPITALQVENCLREARRIYDILLFAGFNFEPEAQAIIQDEHRNLQTHLVQITPDVVMNDLLKQSHTDKLFTVIGAPRVDVTTTENGEFIVKMEGVDSYNPVDNTIEPTEGDKVAAWFVDTNFDGRTFCPTQSFFPDKGAWKNIAKSLRSIINEENLDAFSGTVSLPFTIGEHRCIAVKVIDRRGNELMRIHKL